MAERVVEAVKWFLLILFGVGLISTVTGYLNSTAGYPPVWWWVNLSSTALVFLTIDRTPPPLKRRNLEWVWGAILMVVVAAGMAYPLVRYAVLPAWGVTL